MCCDFLTVLSPLMRSSKILLLLLRYRIANDQLEINPKSRRADGRTDTATTTAVAAASWSARHYLLSEVNQQQLTNTSVNVWHSKRWDA